MPHPTVNLELGVRVFYTHLQCILLRLVELLLPFTEVANITDCTAFYEYILWRTMLNWLEHGI